MSSSWPNVCAALAILAAAPSLAQCGTVLMCVDGREASKSTDYPSTRLGGIIPNKGGF
jgi:hypothetical protein